MFSAALALIVKEEAENRLELVEYLKKRELERDEERDEEGEKEEVDKREIGKEEDRGSLLAGEEKRREEDEEARVAIDICNSTSWLIVLRTSNFKAKFWIKA